MRKVKVAMLRCRPELQIFYETFRRFEVIELVGCWDKDPAKAEAMAEAQGVKAMTLDEIWNDESIEIVFNASDPDDSAPLTRLALEHGKNVYVNKMIAYDFETAKELCAIAKEKGVRLSGGPDTFFGAQLQTARYLLDHKLIGDVLSFSATVSRNSHIYSDEMEYLLKHGGSIIFNIGGYFISALCNLIGPIKSVSAIGKQTEPKHTVSKVTSANFGEVIDRAGYDVLAVNIEFCDGTIGAFHLNANSALRDRVDFEIIGSKGIISMGSPNQFETPVYLYKTGSEPFVFPMTHGFKETHLGIAVPELAWSMLKNRPHRHSAERSLHLTEALCGIEKSIQTGERYEMTTTMTRMEPLPEGFIGNGFWTPREESALAQ